MDPASISSFFFQQGILGVIILVLASFILWLFKRLDDKDKVISNRDQIIMGLQEKRVVDYKDNSEKIIETSRDLSGAMQSLKEAIGVQSNAITKMLDNFVGRSNK